MGDSEWEAYEANIKARKAGRGVLGKKDPLYKKSKRKKRKIMTKVKLTKKFSSKVYKYYGWRATKAKAQSVASRLRREGYLARIERVTGERGTEGIGYRIWRKG